MPKQAAGEYRDIDRTKTESCLSWATQSPTAYHWHNPVKAIMQFPVILADPPVPFEVWSKPTKPGSGNRTAADHYNTMSWRDLFALGPAIQSVAADDCVLMLWMCQPLLRETLAMARRWGFTYKTKGFVWTKLRPDSAATFHVGMGYWTRANSEDVLLYIRGSPARRSKKVRQLILTLEANPYEVPTIIAPMGRHSEKPEEAHERIEQLLDGPYLELFARRQRPGWTCIGNEIDGLDIRESLARLANDEALPIVRSAIEQHSLLEAA